MRSMCIENRACVVSAIHNTPRSVMTIAIILNNPIKPSKCAGVCVGGGVCGGVVGGVWGVCGGCAGVCGLRERWVIKQTIVRAQLPTLELRISYEI